MASPPLQSPQCLSPTPNSLNPPPERRRPSTLSHGSKAIAFSNLFREAIRLPPIPTDAATSHHHQGPTTNRQFLECLTIPRNPWTHHHQDRSGDSQHHLYRWWRCHEGHRMGVKRTLYTVFGVQVCILYGWSPELQRPSDFASVVTRALPTHHAACTPHPVLKRLKPRQRFSLSTQRRCKYSSPIRWLCDPWIRLLSLARSLKLPLLSHRLLPFSLPSKRILLEGPIPASTRLRHVGHAVPQQLPLSSKQTPDANVHKTEKNQLAGCGGLPEDMVADINAEG
ncbi:hypothetical protein BDN72DRAFT_904209 [Pluteus cervinus]|uniref:Uncharacterized protein n=1 Tax=Pluteus cervinus TaxID=181527 RepID=A0ACD3A6N0_9AGAR|nr:hypothetical protein BDN72DRAFT_904209 [Pluteus cervinus]